MVECQNPPWASLIQIWIALVCHKLKLVGLICSLIGGLRPGSPTFSESNQRDVKKRGKGPTQDARINVVDQPKKFLGITRFGFSKQNEVRAATAVTIAPLMLGCLEGRMSADKDWCLLKLFRRLLVDCMSEQEGWFEAQVRLLTVSQQH